LSFLYHSYLSIDTFSFRHHVLYHGFYLGAHWLMNHGNSVCHFVHCKSLCTGVILEFDELGRTMRCDDMVEMIMGNEDGLISLSYIYHSLVELLFSSLCEKNHGIDTPIFSLRASHIERPSCSYCTLATRARKPANFNCKCNYFWKHRNSGLNTTSHVLFVHITCLLQLRRFFESSTHQIGRKTHARVHRYGTQARHSACILQPLRPILHPWHAAVEVETTRPRVFISESESKMKQIPSKHTSLSSPLKIRHLAIAVRFCKDQGWCRFEDSSQKDMRSGIT